MAHSDTATGKIYGCKKGSLEWFHEKGHLEFDKIPKYSFLLLIKGYLFGLWIFFIMITFVIDFCFVLAVICFLMYFGIFLFEEYWSERYAIINFSRVGGKRSNSNLYK